MECQKIRSGVDKRLHITNRPVDHQMNIDETVSMLPQGFQYRNTDRNVGDEFPVHHIKMNIICPALQAFIHILPELCKIGRKN